jgi:glycosidase
MHPSFDMTYDWDLYRTFNGIAKDKKNASAIVSHLTRDWRRYPATAYRMQFTSNHDENSWNGTEYERLGAGAEAFAVVAFTVPGMPLIYSGQEAGLDRRLAFFDKDPIEWREHGMTSVYRSLLALKRRNRALWNGASGGPMIRVHTSEDKAILAFVRARDENQVFVVANLSAHPLSFRLKGTLFPGTYTDLFSAERVTFDRKATLSLGPWEYRVYER